MKKISVSREQFPAVFSSCKNLAELIKWAEHSGEKEQLVVSKLFLNDKFLDEEEEGLLSSLAVSEVHKLEVEYMPIPHLVGETMKSIISLLQDLQLKSISQSESLLRDPRFDSQEIKEIFAKSKMLIHTLEEVFQVHSSGKFQLRHFSLWLESERELSGILQCILQSVEMQDATLVSELFAVAYPQALMHWEEVLEKEILDNKAIAQIFNLKFNGRGSDNGVDV